MEQIATAVSNIIQETGHPPISMKELVGTNPLKKGWKLDPWEQPYSYTRINADTLSLIEIKSSGSDLVFSTEDDIALTIKVN